MNQRTQPFVAFGMVNTVSERKITMSNINVSDYVVRSSGSIDVEATVANFRSALSVHLAERETQQATIADAVHTVFDQYKGQTISMPSLTGLALQALNVQPENFGALTERVQEYVREQSKGEASIFVIAKGKGGGCSRRADKPATASK